MACGSWRGTAGIGSASFGFTSSDFFRQWLQSITGRCIGTLWTGRTGCHICESNEGLASFFSGTDLFGEGVAGLLSASDSTFEVFRDV